MRAKFLKQLLGHLPMQQKKNTILTIITTIVNLILELLGKKVANVYQAKKGTKDQSEYLKAVNVAFVGNDVSVTIRVYTNLYGSGQLQVERGILSAQKLRFLNMEVITR